MRNKEKLHLYCILSTCVLMLIVSREREKIQPLTTCFTTRYQTTCFTTRYQTTCFTTRYQHDRSLSTTRAEGVVIKLDAGTLAVVHVIGYFDNVDYFNVTSDRICSDSSSRRKVPRPCRTILRDRLRIRSLNKAARYEFF